MSSNTPEVVGDMGNNSTPGVWLFMILLPPLPKVSWFSKHYNLEGLRDLPEPDRSIAAFVGGITVRPISSDIIPYTYRRLYNRSLYRLDRQTDYNVDTNDPSGVFWFTARGEWDVKPLFLPKTGWARTNFYDDWTTYCYTGPVLATQLQKLFEIAWKGLQYNRESINVVKQILTSIANLQGEKLIRIASLRDILDYCISYANFVQKTLHVEFEEIILMRSERDFEVLFSSTKAFYAKLDQPDYAPKELRGYFDRHNFRQIG